MKKYIQKKVSEEVPDKEGWYHTDVGHIYYCDGKWSEDSFFTGYWDLSFPKYWYKEIECNCKCKVSIQHEIASKLKPLSNLLAMIEADAIRVCIESQLPLAKESIVYLSNFLNE